MRRRYDIHPLVPLSLTQKRTVERNTIKQFQQQVWKYYRVYGRHNMPWRKTRDPYKILVSEIMLQQTQVARVEKFYPKFIKTFPDFRTLARAPLKNILCVWQGMGYNRRAVALKKLAQEVIEKHRGKLPNDVEALEQLPGIGEATAGAIAVYAFNTSVAFVETNIRRTYIHYFLSREHTPSSRLPLSRGRIISDQEILKLIKLTLDRKDPRAWYWALMDYGAMLGGKLKDNPNIRSSQYREQSKFEGSRRQMRGRVLKWLLGRKGATCGEMVKVLAVDRQHVQQVLSELTREELVRLERGKYRIV